MRILSYYNDAIRFKAEKVSTMLGLPVSRLLGFLLDYYIRKEKIVLEKKDEVK
jgi:antitoxin component of RelBE/YafQ-DinJ toxin-antitoxin module